MSYIRPTWDEYFLEMMEAASKRATCDRGRSGCVIARGNQLLVTGYVGSPIGFPHCDEVGHLIKKVTTTSNGVTEESEHCKRTIHAEKNAICQAAKLGVSIESATLYCRMTPCVDCAMAIVQCGITRVVCQRRYHRAAESIEFFKVAGIELEHVEDTEQKYE
jgi:dCMP deaminase